MTPTTQPTRPGTLARLTARFRAVDVALAADALDGITTDAEAAAFMDSLEPFLEGVLDAYEARDAAALTRYASGVRWRRIVPLGELKRTYGGLHPIHRKHVAVDLAAGHLLRQLETAPAA